MDEVSGYFDFAEVQAIRHRPMYIRKNIYRPESLQWLAIKGKAVRIQFMKGDMTVPCGDGMINIRVGAIILKDGKFLMAGNERSDYLYSVGGRVKFGETAQEAVVREVPEHFCLSVAVLRRMKAGNICGGYLPGTKETCIRNSFGQNCFIHRIR